MNRMLVRSRFTVRSLNEAQAADVLDLLELELEDLLRRRIETHHFLIGEAKALHQLDVPKMILVVEPASAVVSATITFWIVLYASADR